MKIMDDSVNNLFGIREEHADKDVKAIYNKEKANANINNLIDFVIRGLCKLNKPFKYSVTGVIMQNNGAGLNTCSTPHFIQHSHTTTPTTMEQSRFKGKSEITSSFSPSSPCKFDIFIDWSHNNPFIHP
jgi:Tctex-1 family